MSVNPTTCDVFIAGGGMAGLCLARQLRRELPQLRVVVAERTRRPLSEASHKVGESNAELGSQYLERLGLTDYLRQRHVVKLGLRFFPGGGHVPFEQRAELGPALDPVVKGYQIDRGRFEQDLRGMVEDDGVTLLEGVIVRGVEFGDGGHSITVDRDGTRTQMQARWFVDATGRTASLRRRFGSKTDSGHTSSAGWFRTQGRVLPQDLTTDAPQEWTDAPLADERWRSTCHLMGRGYWMWIIALPEDRTSIGVVVDETTHGFDRVRTLERITAFIAEHEPALARKLEELEILDSRCIRSYSHGIERSWSAQRWAIVGDAGAFVDPLYSPGTDFIALSNSFTLELIRADYDGEELEPLVDALEEQYQGLLEGSLGVYRQSGATYEHARALATKVYWDNFAYWSYTCQYYLQGLYKIRGDYEAQLSAVRRRWVELSGYVQALTRVWATRHPEPPKPGFFTMPPFPSYAVDAHLDLQKELTPDEALELTRTRLAQGEKMIAEFVARLLLEYGPEQGRALLKEAGALEFELPWDPARAEGEPTVGLKRRKSLSREVRDVERAFGRVERHPQWEEALAVLTSAAS